MKMQSIIFGIILSVFFLSIAGAAQENQTNETDLVDDIEPYEGSVGPDSAFYGLKIALENFDEALTFNSSEKLRKQLAREGLRIAEVKAELGRNNTEAAGRALERFQIKIEATESLISGITGEDTGLLNAQNMTVKHQYVLERLLESHPNNTGLQRAYNNSLRLEEKFENKTERKLERVATNGRMKIKIREIEREKIEIKAKIIGNATQVKVEVKFLTNSTENSTIAQDILAKIRLSSENISRIIDIEAEEEEEKELKTELEAEAKVEAGATKVEAGYKFPLNTTNRTEILEGVYQKLWALTPEDITTVLKIKIREIEREKTEIKAKIIGNATQVKVEVKFLTNSTENFTIAQDILGKIRLSSENIARIMDFEAEEEEEDELKTKLEAEAKVEPGATKVEAEYKFPLNTTNRTEILEGVYQKLWALTVDDVTKALKISVEGRKAEKVGIKEEKREGREEGKRTEATDRGRGVEEEENETSRR